MNFAPIILLKKSSSISLTQPALNTKPTAIKAIARKPMSFENSRLKLKYKPMTTIAINTRDCALLKNQLYKYRPDFILHSSIFFDNQIFDFGSLLLQYFLMAFYQLGLVNRGFNDFCIIDFIQLSTMLVASFAFPLI